MTDRRAPSGSGPLDHHAREIAEDKLRVRRLKALPSGHPDVIQYSFQLRTYGLGRMLKLVKNSRELAAEIRRLVGARLPQVPDYWDFPPIETLAYFSVYKSVEPFFDSAIRRGGWDPRRNTTLRGYFFGKCLAALVDEFRRAHDITKKADGHFPLDLVPDYELDVARWWQREASPEKIVVDRDRIRRLLQDVRYTNIPQIVYYRSQKYTFKEIAAKIGSTEGALSMALRRFQDDLGTGDERGEK